MQAAVCTTPVRHFRPSTVWKDHTSEKNLSRIHLRLFEVLEKRTFATTDPRGFLATHHNGKGIILDEIQHAPDLLSYIQTYVDEHSILGSFVITGSHNFLIMRPFRKHLPAELPLGRCSPCP